ncbi:RNA polymerase sigma factor [Limnoglobus roseus]|uniref:Sigma-70 family RNA polymerase sigma factor n=1 Tax=Limnoglobus roseus TaxID=2598579 RepID=A0A5C1AS05_9BACT|nr:sigma-70 family RNA polymerase sigma factor [Limnoglobus roseus]QEL20816.1 sigma-70 family RNA polymerase sigma factor [Limnoglobus roseus]
MTQDTVEIPDDELAATLATRGESAQARTRAEAAFRTLYDRHAKRLLAFLGGRVNAAALDDVHQDVWAKVWQAVPTRYHGGNFRAWVHQVARNVVIDHGRKRGFAPLTEGENVVDHRQADDATAVEAERRAALAKCLQKLERANAAVADLVRSRVAGESYDSYCTRTGMPSDKAYRAFHQAKAQLQACVEGISP